VWRLTMFLMCLIAALSGTPLRQAEAASDLARALAESGRGDDIEVPDGGVGDDSEAAVKAESTEVSGTIDLSVDVLPGCSSPIAPTAWSLFNRLDDPRPRSAASLSARLARLQCFLC
jgi:hypothetical protein